MPRGSSTLFIALTAIYGYAYFCYMYLSGATGPVEAQTVGMILGEWKAIAALAFGYYLASSLGSTNKDVALNEFRKVTPPKQEEPKNETPTETKTTQPA